MGRGRAKAKQTKVARELKYRTEETDFDALQRELHGDDDQATSDGQAPSDDADDDPDDHRDGHRDDGLGEDRADDFDPAGDARRD